MIINANLIEQQSLQTNLKEYHFKNLDKIKETKLVGDYDTDNNNKPQEE